MRFSLFVHMERPRGGPSHRVLYEQFMELCCIADQGGMHTIWTGEHHAMEFTITPNPFLTLIDIAHRTEHVRLGTSAVVAPYWHPLKLAEEAAMADLITEGRLELGLARGAYTFEYERLVPGMDAQEAGERLRESAPLLPRLWAGDCAHEGAYWRFPTTSAIPRPAQPHGPPIWIAARDPASHQFAVDHAFNVQVTPLWQGLEEIEVLKQRFDVACAKVNGPPPEIMLLHHTYVAKDEADANAAAHELSRFYCYFNAWFRNQDPVIQGQIKTLGEAQMEANVAMAPQKLRRDLTIGTTPEVIERVEAYRALGFDEYALWIDSGMSHARKRASLERFITEVMPAFEVTQPLPRTAQAALSL